HQYGGVVVRRLALCGKLVLQRQIPRQGHQTGQGFIKSQASMKCHGAALRKSRQHNMLTGNAAYVLACNQRPDGVFGLPDAGLDLLTHQVRAENIVPGAHGHAVVDGYWSDGGVGKQKPDGRQAIEIQFGNDGSEVVAVSPQAMQPYDGAGGIGAGLNYYAF